MPIVALDYTKARILMEVTSDLEIQWRVQACKKEPWTVEFIEAIPPDAVFWDIGANVGSYALIAAARGLRVVAMEPAYENYRGLCRNLALNNWLDKVLALPCGLGENSGFEWLHYTDLRSGAASHVMGGERKVTHHKQQVQLWRLDDFYQMVGVAGPHYAKIDVDGGELSVMLGAQAYLRDPGVQGLMIEMQNENEAPITKLMTDAGWQCTFRTDQRDGKNMGIVYAQFGRV